MNDIESSPGDIAISVSTTEHNRVSRVSRYTQRLLRGVAKVCYRGDQQTGNRPGLTQTSQAATRTEATRIRDYTNSSTKFMDRQEELARQVEVELQIGGSCVAPKE